ncbi:Sensor protein SrrB [compost metagenome]
MHTKLIEQAAKSVEKMSVLVDELLNMNRISQDQLQLECNDFSLYDMLLVSSDHTRVEGKYQLVLTGNQQLMVNADEHRIDQVVVNFINNAIKYASDSKEIHLHVERVGDTAKVSVTDFGPGIAEQVLPHLFDRYYRVDHSGKEYKGLGLGLYICSEIIKKHGGEIGVESTLGKGSTFWFTLPL